MNSKGAKLIAEERRRQVEEEGWDAKHDAQHSPGDLSYVARCYTSVYIHENTPLPEGWPWNVEYWKPSDDKIKNLVRAGALIAAEIDLLLRRKKHLD